MYVRVRAHPDAKKELILKESDSEYTISVKEKAERNQANKRIIEIIAEEFNIPTNRVKMITGHRSPRKIISIE
ncbi:MAG: DUF167 domain-containing protein [Candidatus Pacebacteria bacterium]|nr:DUF167 domain-containing protein [Candidatus Paceibacterota bacterium]